MIILAQVPAEQWSQDILVPQLPNLNSRNFKETYNNQKWNYVYVIRYVLNSLINKNYKEVNLNNVILKEDLALFLERNIKANYPVILNIEVPVGGELPNTGGHYIVVKGIYKANGSSDYYVVVNDLTYKSWNWEYYQSAVLSLDTLFSYFDKGNKYAISGLY